MNKIAVILFVSFAFGIPSTSADDNSIARGKKVYAQKCASCHAADGQGVDEIYDQPFAGEYSLAELTHRVERTMPEDQPESCVGQEARDVAEYVYSAFYKGAKMARPRIELVRLTSTQHRNALADIMAEAVVGRASKKRKGQGLQGKYFASRSTNAKDLKFKRLDPTINFQFGNETPDPEKIETDEFSIFWEGAVIAPQTGTYEFIIKSKNGFHFWINHKNKPTIDGWVSDGKTEEHRTSLFLLAGRRYPIKLIMFRLKGDTASIALDWIGPSGVRELVPQSALVPGWHPITSAIESSFPADDASVGYQRGTAVSRAWDEATTTAAIEFANQLVDHLQNNVRVEEGTEQQATKYKEICNKVLRLAFRRPLTKDETEFFIERQFARAPNAATAVKRAMLLGLRSPRFLYLDFGKPESGPFVTAAKLSFAIWDSVPDQQLMEAAAEGRLVKREQIRKQAERMIADSRCHQKVREFFQHWLEFDRADEISKDPTVFPDFNSQLLHDLRTSMELFLDEVTWGPESDFRQLFLSKSFYVNKRLAEFYGIEKPVEGDFQPVEFEPEHRAGILTHPFLMSGLAYHRNTSPIHRGVFVARSLLGRTLNPPPVNVEPLDESFDPSLTTRERVVHQTKEKSCMNCHSVINPLGFSLENYDAVGRFRDSERDKPIDVKTRFETLTGNWIEFSGAGDLAKFLATSERSHMSFVEHVFHHMVKQPLAAYGEDAHQRLYDAFKKSNYNMQQLIIEIAVLTAEYEANPE